MAKHHKYVFDEDARRFIGNFEEMYRRESIDNFDSWHQGDARQIQRVTAQSVLNQWNFDLILDLGCEKGALTHTLKNPSFYLYLQNLRIYKE